MWAMTIANVTDSSVDQEPELNQWLQNETAGD